MCDINDKIYTTICSEKTLQSDTNGFFLQFADHVINMAGFDWLNNEFVKYKTDRERITGVFNDEKIKDIVRDTLSNVQCVYRKKDGKVSRDRRHEAEAFMKKGNTIKALMFYCQSVLRAPPKGVDLLTDAGLTLSLALWGRSAILASTGDVVSAMNDLQLALREGLPDKHKPELYLRMSAYYKALGETNRAKVSQSLAERLYKNKQKEMEVAKANIKIGEVKKKLDRKYLPDIAEGSHEKYEYASSLLELKEDANMGRYFVAKRNISTGDTLVVEPPRAACLLPEYFGTNCHHCLQRLTAPVGCTECSSIAFCSTHCRDKALNTYHKFECKILDMLIGSGMSILCHVALRIVTQDGLTRCLEIIKDKSLDNMHSLCGHYDQREPKDFLQRSLMAAFLLKCLQKCGFFPKRKDDSMELSDEELSVGELLLSYMQLLQFNAHEIYETRYAQHRLKTAKTVYTGVGIYPTIAYFNHDCYPGVLRYYVDKNLVIKAVRPFKPGEIVPENYGPIFLKKNVKERQRALLSRYWFKCQCVACKENWPCSDKIKNCNVRYRCPTNNCDNLFSQSNDVEVTCSKCKTKVSLKDTIDKVNYCEKQLELGLEAVQEQDPEKAISIFTKTIDLFHSVASPPHKDIHQAELTLRTCYADSGTVCDCIIAT